MDIADLLSRLTDEGETVTKVEIWEYYKPTNYELVDYINNTVYCFQMIDNGTLRVHI